MKSCSVPLCLSTTAPCEIVNVGANVLSCSLVISSEIIKLISVPSIIGSPITISLLKIKVKISASELLSAAILEPSKLTSILNIATLTFIFIDSLPSLIEPATSKLHSPGAKVTAPVPVKIQPLPAFTALMPSNSISPNSPIPG